MNEKKKFKWNVLFVVVMIVLFSFKDQSSILDTYRVGDVIYSLLNETDFKKLHGDGWQLLDGTPLTKETTLGSILIHSDIEKNPDGTIKLPDARGQFIRAMNGNRLDGHGDPYNKEKGAARVVGASQEDAFQNHNHRIYISMAGPYGGTPDGGGSSTMPAVLQGSNQQNNKFPNDIIIQPESDVKETRPSNISLYVYVKVSN